MHASIHVVDASKIDQNEGSDVVEFIDKHIICALPNETKYPEISKLINKVQTHHHTTPCRNKNGVACRFNAQWVPSDETRIVCSEVNIDETKVKQSKKVIEKVFSQQVSCLI